MPYSKTPPGGGAATGTHNPVWTSSAFPGTQNGAQPLVAPVSPGRHAELTAGETTMIQAIGAAARRCHGQRRNDKPTQ